MASAATTTAGILAVTVGGGLVWAALTGRSPLDELRAALTTGRPSGSTGRRLDVDQAAGIGAVVEAGATVGQLAGEAAAAAGELVPIGQGSHRLTGAAAAAFKRWEAAYGRTIPVTDSYRSYAQQAAGHRADPDRFAAPTSSAHVTGQAVDVNLRALGILQGRRGESSYDRLYNAAVATGWCSYTKGLSGDTWHFSYGVCK